MYKTYFTDHFKRQLKLLQKKDPLLKENLSKCLKEFKKEHAIALGQYTYKIRLKAQGKRKSGGYRAYLLVLEIKNLIAPVCIYAKSDQGNIPINEVRWRTRIVTAELRGMM